VKLRQMRDDLRQPHSLVIIFKPYQQSVGLPWATQGLAVLEQLTDGTIYHPGQSGQ
jgi:hypothetical protein